MNLHNEMKPYWSSATFCETSSPQHPRIINWVLSENFQLIPCRSSHCSSRKKASNFLWKAFKFSTHSGCCQLSLIRLILFFDHLLVKRGFHASLARLASDEIIQRNRSAVSEMRKKENEKPHKREKREKTQKIIFFVSQNSVCRRVGLKASEYIANSIISGFLLIPYQNSTECYVHT